MNHTTRSRIVFTCLLFSIAALAAFQINQTRGASIPQNENGNANSQKKEKRIEEVTVRESANKVKCKSGYEFVRVSKNEVTVRSAGSRVKTNYGPVIHGSFRCDCTDTTGNGTCDGELVGGSFACVPQNCKTCQLVIP